MEPPRSQHQDPEARPGEASPGAGKSPAGAGSSPSRRGKYLSPSPTLCLREAGRSPAPHGYSRAPPAALTLGAARHRLHAAAGGRRAARFGPRPRVRPGAEGEDRAAAGPLRTGLTRRRRPPFLPGRAALPPSRESHQTLARGRESRARGEGWAGRAASNKISPAATSREKRRALPSPLPVSSAKSRGIGQRPVRAAAVLLLLLSSSRERWLWVSRELAGAPLGRGAVSLWEVSG